MDLPPAPNPDTGAPGTDTSPLVPFPSARTPRRVAVIGNYIPRKCGIATFTADLTEQLARFRPEVTTDVWALDDAASPLEYVGIAGAFLFAWLSRRLGNVPALMIAVTVWIFICAGAYFITLCTHGRECLFGQIIDGEMRLNALGEIARAEWELTGRLRADIELGQYVIMPNHFHGIIWIIDDRGRGTARDGGRGTARRAPTTTTHEQFGKPVAGSIPTIVRAFKSAVTRQINQVRQTPGAPVWQRNYYEHIIRDERSWQNIAAYILNNPRQWELDQLFISAESH